jgi:isopenicillin N synthase-like dioxygenase
VTLSTPDQAGLELRECIQNLFASSRKFFARDEQYKQQFRTKLGSEDGWSSIPGEKQFITIRTLNEVPEELREATKAAWDKMGAYLNSMLVRIAESLELSPDALTKFSEPCISLDNKRRATMLRLFRYEGWEDKVVAEPHNDLGLLSLVAGDSPGLEVWNGMQNLFYPIEKSYKDLSSAATVLVGRQLQKLTNGRYRPGMHRVTSTPKPQKFLKSNKAGKRFRYSIVFVLRAHDDVIIDTKALTSRITGKPAMVADGMQVRQLFESIRLAHYNINTGIKAREEQRQKIKERKQRQDVMTNGNKVVLENHSEENPAKGREDIR